MNLPEKGNTINFAMGLGTGIIKQSVGRMKEQITGIRIWLFLEGKMEETRVVKTSWNLQEWPKQNLLVMRDMEPELPFFYNQLVKLTAMCLGNQPSHKTFNLQSALPANVLGNWDAELVGLVSQWPVEIEAHIMRRSPCLTLPRCLETIGRTAKRSRIENKHNLQNKKGQWNDS